MKRKAFWASLAAGMTVVSTGVVSAQWTDGETLKKMISGAAGSRVAMSSPESTAALPRVGMLGEFKKKSLVGSWLETVTFPPDENGDVRVLKSLVSFHDDGTMLASDQGSVMFDPPPTDPKAPQTGTVTSDGVGAWTQTDWRTFVYTTKELFSDLRGNLVGFLKVRGIYKLSGSGDKYNGTSFFEVSDTNSNLLVSGNVTNAGERIRVELPPP